MNAMIRLVAILVKPGRRSVVRSSLVLLYMSLSLSLSLGRQLVDKWLSRWRHVGVTLALSYPALALGHR